MSNEQLLSIIKKLCRCASIECVSSSESKDIHSGCFKQPERTPCNLAFSGDREFAQLQRRSLMQHLVMHCS